MTSFKLNKRGMADLEKQIQQQFKKAETKANQAAARESTPEAKARAFAEVLRNYGVENVNESEIRRRFGG